MTKIRYWFNELKRDINEVKIKCESSCNELKRDMEKVVESVAVSYTHLDVYKRQVDD